MDVLEAANALDDENDSQVARVRLLCIKNLASIEEETGEWQVAVEYFVEGVRLDPSDTVFAFRLAKLALEKLGNVRLARASLEVALKSDPHFWPALTMLLEMLFSLGDDIGCLDAAARCLVEQPFYARALEIRGTILIRNGAVGRVHEAFSEGGASTAKPRLEIVRPVRFVSERSNAAPPEPVMVRISWLTWADVASKIVSKLKHGTVAPVVLSWSEARAPTPNTNVVNEDSNNPPVIVIDDEPSVNIAPSPVKQIVLRMDVEQQQHADLKHLLLSFFPWTTVLHGKNAAAAAAAAAADVTFAQDVSAAPLADGSSTLLSQTEVVQRWLSTSKAKYDALELMDALCSALFSKVTDVWSSALQKSGIALAKLVLLWDLAPREYFLPLAELAVDSVNSASQRSSATAVAHVARKLLERFCCEFPDILRRRDVSTLVLRVERVKGLLCKLLGEGDAVQHFKAVKAMSELPEMHSVFLAHSGIVIGSEWILRELALVDQSEQCRVALAHFKAKNFVKVVEALAPALLVSAGEQELQMDAKRRLSLVEKLYLSVKELRFGGSKEASAEWVALFPRVALAYVAELRRDNEGAPSSGGVASDLRGVLTEVRKTDFGDWTAEQKLILQCHCAALISSCRGNKHFNGVLSTAWETVFFFMERPLPHAALNLLHNALDTIVEVDACRLNRGSFLRLVISEMLPGIHRFGGEDPPDEWSWALHQSIQCLFGVRMSNVKKGHKCESKGEESMVDQLAEVFEYVGPSLQDQDMNGLSRKIYQQFSVLPAQLHTRFADVQAMVFDGAQDGSSAALRLPEKIKEEDAQNIPHFQVYRDIYAWHVVHVLPAKFCKKLHNKSRQSLRSAIQRKWFDSKAVEESKKILLLDLTVNPDRFESWFMLGMLMRACADHRLALEPFALKQLSAEARNKQAEWRSASMRCLQSSLLCNTSDGKEKKKKVV